MIYNFKRRKKEVLRVYEDYLPYEQKYGDNIKLAKLGKERTNFEAGKFFLMVIGEAKSGKSTFINAFLGIEILPMGSRQCTSALIEINYGDKIALEAIYANDRKEVFFGEKRVSAFLEEYVALNDDYRKMPVTPINNEILVKSKDKWQDIVTRIYITYPFSENMQEFTIIDSPSVNAAGKVGDTTNQYIKKADAIIFVKPLTEPFEESSSFRNFLSSNALSEGKKALLLVLTKKSESEDEYAFKAWKQTAETYKRSISEKRIIAVDSMLQLIFHKCQDKSVKEIDDILNQKEYDCLSAKHYWQSNKIRLEYLDILEKKSNFLEVINILTEFSIKAQYRQCVNFLTLINGACEAIQEELGKRFDSLQKDAEDLAYLEKERDKKLKEIEEVELKMDKDIERILLQYTNDENLFIKRDVEKAIEYYKKRFTEANKFDDLREIILLEEYDFLYLQLIIQTNTINHFNRRFIELTEASLPLPGYFLFLSEDDLEKIKTETENGAKETKWSQKKINDTYLVFKKKEISIHKHISLVKNKIIEKLNEKKSLIINSLYDFVKKSIKIYWKELKDSKDKKNQELYALSLRIICAEGTHDAMKNIKDDLSAIELIVKRLRSIKGGIGSGIS
jgi:GTPase Era involved in 16S rRNA processing